MKLVLWLSWAWCLSACTSCLSDLSGSLCDDAGACGAGYSCCVGRCIASTTVCIPGHGPGAPCNRANACDAGFFCCAGLCQAEAVACDAGCEGQVVYEPESFTPIDCDAGCQGSGSSCTCDQQCCSGQCLDHVCATRASQCAGLDAGCGDWNDCCPGLACMLGSPQVCVPATSGQFGNGVFCGFIDQCGQGMWCDEGQCPGHPGTRCTGICFGVMDGGGTGKSSPCTGQTCDCGLICGPAGRCCLQDGQECLSATYCCSEVCDAGVCASGT
jgi:hypothetical protein